MKKTKLTLVLLGSLLGFSAFAQENNNLLERYFNTHRATVLGTDPGSYFQIYNTDRSASLKGDVVKFVQTVNQIPVYQAEGTALISDNQMHRFSVK